MPLFRDMVRAFVRRTSVQTSPSSTNTSATPSAAPMFLGSDQLPQPQSTNGHSTKFMRGLIKTKTQEEIKMNMQSTTTTSQTAVVTNVTQTGSAFGIVLGSGEGIFIPVAVATAGVAKIGSLYAMDTIPNPNELSHDKTPLMCVHMAPTDTQVVGHVAAPAVTADEARAFTMKTLKEGGVWTAPDIFRELMNDPNARRECNSQAYTAIGHEVRRMHSVDEVSRIVLYRNGTQTRASIEWWTCVTDVEPCEMLDE